MIYHCTDSRQHGTSLFYIIVRKGTARSSDILKTLITMFSFHNVRVERAESHAPNFKIILRFIYLHIYVISVTIIYISKESVQSYRIREVINREREFLVASELDPTGAEARAANPALGQRGVCHKKRDHPKAIEQQKRHA